MIPPTEVALYLARHFGVKARWSSALEHYVERPYRARDDANNLQVHSILLDDRQFLQKEFKKFSGRQPLVIRGFIKEVAREPWSLDNLRLPELSEIPVVMKYCARHAAQVWDPGLKKVPLSAALKAIDENPTANVISASELSHKMRARQNWAWIQSLEDTFGRHCFATQLLFGGSATGTAFHSESGENFFLELGGVKSWALVSPEESPCMYPILGLKNYYGSPVQSEYRDSPDQTANYPLARKAKMLRVDLHPGDLLYIPPWWWHEVRNREPYVGLSIRTSGHLTQDFPRTILALALLDRSYRTEYLREVAQITRHIVFKGSKHIDKLTL